MSAAQRLEMHARLGTEDAELYPPMDRDRLRRTMYLAHLLGDPLQADERPGDDNEFRRLWSRHGWPAQAAWDATRYVVTASAVSTGRNT